MLFSLICAPPRDKSGWGQIADSARLGIQAGVVLDRPTLDATFAGLATLVSRLGTPTQTMITAGPGHNGLHFA